jgi:uncharacterized membrane protein
MERWISLAAATVMIGYGVSRRSAFGLFVAAAAAPLAYRSIAGKWPWFDDRRASAGACVYLRESVRIGRPADEVSALWRQMDNLPRFMTHLESVTDLGGGRSHWVARGTAGSRIEWDAQIMEDTDENVIGWHSLPGSDVVSAGLVAFSTPRDGECEVSVTLQYEPPVGRAGATAADVLGLTPSKAIREDLLHVKKLLEDPAAFRDGPL